MEELRAFVRSRQPMNLLIVVINVVVFLVLSMLGDTQSASFMAGHGASYTPFILEYGEYYRLVTCMFLHFGVQHLVYNMLLLIFLGDTLEKHVGKLRYLLIYLLGGIAGNGVSMLFDLRTGRYAVSAGASGAIFAVLGATIWIVLREKGKLDGYSIKRLLLMTALSVAEGFTAQGIDNCAHVGGLLAGFVLAVVLYRGKSRKAVNREHRKV